MSYHGIVSTRARDRSIFSAAVTGVRARVRMRKMIPE
jgi:hypothetical protein